jgi:hypothetical protein
MRVGLGQVTPRSLVSASRERTTVSMITGVSARSRSSW